MIKNRVDIIDLKEKYESIDEETTFVRGYITYKMKYGYF